MCPVPPPAELAPLAAADFAAVRRLAHGIWHGHYDGIVGAAQVDFMLARRCADAALAAYLGAADRWFDVLRVGGEPVGYCSCALVPEEGVLKLEQLYVAGPHRGLGLGRLMLGHVECRARACGRHTILLQVNKRNAAAIDFYRRAGFTVREEAVFDIGGGFVMDDFVMTKRLA
ncbi:MAG: GNAT family N-acetyltransferase [Planctomycetaceae bacterium]